MKKGLVVLAVSLVAGAATVACGGGSDGGGTPTPTIYGSCASSDGTCDDVSGESLTAALAASLQAEQCDSAQGETWSTTACVATNRFGTCTFDLGQMFGDAGGVPLKIHRRYYAATLNSVAVSALCDDIGGVWVAN